METLAAWSGFAISLLLIVVAGVSRKIVRGTGFAASDFYLGLELTLTAIALSALNLVDDLAHTGPRVRPEALLGVVYTVLCFAFYFVQLAAQQEYQTGRGRSPRWRAHHLQMVLGFGMDAVGIVLMVAFTLMKSRGRL